MAQAKQYKDVEAMAAYNGELLCPLCGSNDLGLKLPGCTTPGWTHVETCAKKVWADDLCDSCMELDKHEAENHPRL